MASVSSETGEPSKAAGDSRVIKPPPSSPPEMQLKRFLYLNKPCLSYVAGNPEVYGQFQRGNLTCIDELLGSTDTKKTDLFFNIIENVSGENLLPRRDNLFFVMALAATSDVAKADVKTKVYRTVALITKSDRDYFAFIRYYTLERNNIPSGLNKSITRFYLSKEPIQLAKDITQFKGYRGWKHKDLIKLSHAKSTVKCVAMVLTYILRGLEKARLEADASDECEKVLEILTDAWQLRTSYDEEKVLGLLPKLKNFTEYQIHPNLHKSLPIWNIIIERLSLQKLLAKLLYFYKCEFFQNADFLAKIIERVTNVELIRESKIHPIEVFIAARHFEKGGKPKDPKLINFLDEEEDLKHSRKGTEPDYVKPNFSYIEAPKCLKLVTALHKTLALSYGNVSSLGKRYMITIEVSDDMNKLSLKNRNITCLEAAVLMALSIYKSEKNVTIGVFNGDSITQITFEKGCNFPTALAKVKEAAHDYVGYGQPIDWANTKKKQVDVFLNLVHNIIPRRIPKGVVCNPSSALEKYHNRKGSSPNTKLILHSLGRSSGTYFDSRHNYILNLHGFDDKIAPLISAFITDKF